MSPMGLQSQMSMRSGGWKPLEAIIGWRGGCRMMPM